jgi:hypothetical protein
MLYLNYSYIYRYPMLDLLLLLFLGSSPLVQKTQICLPPDRDYAAKYAPVLYGYICEGECCDYWPKFAAIDPARRYGVLDPFDDLRAGGAGKERLHAEEVGVEYWSKERLVYCDL